MDSNKIVVATIKDTHFGKEDHGIFSFALLLATDCTLQWFGHYELDDYSNKLHKRVFTSYGMELINEILKTVGVDKWEDLKGRKCRFIDEGLAKCVHTIGNITEDKWLDVPKFFCEYYANHANQTIYCDDVPVVKEVSEMETAYPRGCDHAEVMQVIKTVAPKGNGTENDPVREVIQYWSFDGKLLATVDEFISSKEENEKNREKSC